MNEPGKTKNSKKIFAGGDENSNRLLRDLANACRGLVFISETDADLKPFVAGQVRSRSLTAYLKELDIDDEYIEEVSFDNFFARLTTEKDWHRAIDKKRTGQFAKLRAVLEDELKDLRVIRVGRIMIDIYIAGVDAEGRLAGVKTKAIET